jgi:hypothetical protein
MYIRNSTASAVYKLAIIAFAAYGVARSIDGYGCVTLRFFTLQSNILVLSVVLYLLGEGLVRARARRTPAGAAPTAGHNSAPRASRAATYLRGIAMLAISLTGLVFHILLVPLLPSPIGFDSHVLHTIVPILFVLDWLVFSQKGRFRFREVPLWMVYPLVYLVTTLLVAAYYDGFYPYPFMDAATYGYGSVAETSALLVVAFGALGLAYVGIDRLLARWALVRWQKAAAAAED